MRIVIFCHSLLSDWNHGNAHFLRGIASEIIARGHEITFYEPRDGWSLSNLMRYHGIGPLHEFRKRYPRLSSVLYDPAHLDLDSVLDSADLVLVHEWNEPELVEAIGAHRRSRDGMADYDYRLLFHDTHHRCVTAPEEMQRNNLRDYDGVLAFGDRIRDYYLKQRLTGAAWTWQEAADTRRFVPLRADHAAEDLVWVGNWGDEERTEELREFVMEPVTRAGLTGTAYGVRYPADGVAAFRKAGIGYRGWLPNYEVPQTFARHAFTVHVPRRPYLEALPEIPTIRPFEAMACGTPLICARWNDPQRMFLPGSFLVARDGREMSGQMLDVTRDERMRDELVQNGLASIRRAHTCAHRVDELWGICRDLGLSVQDAPQESPAQSIAAR